MTERLYYNNSYLSEFNAEVVAADGPRIYLDRTAFYPTSGGQPFDLGALGGVAVNEVIDEGGRIAHVLEAPLAPGPVTGQIDWTRRFDHMQQHTGQHLLSAVFIDLLNAPTVSFHLGVEAATIEIALPALDSAQVQAVEQRANQIVFENRPVHVDYKHASEATDLRKASEREGELRIVTIENLDRSACGGTHVSATGEIGPILIRKLDKIRGNTRVEFLCGMRAVRRARADYEALSKIARSFSAPLDDTPELVTAQIEKAKEADKARAKLASELAAARGRELHAATPPGPDGLRRITRQLPVITEDLRAEAQSFTAGEKAVMLVLAADPPSVLLTASKDSGIHAGQWLKAALAEAGGRGGGSAALAQGSLPSTEALQVIANRVL